MTDLQSRIAALSPRQRELLEQRVAELAAERVPVPGERIGPRSGTGPVPLALQQEREWAMAQFRSANNIPGAFRVEGEFDLALFGRIFTALVERHEVLRSTVELRGDGTRVQVLHPSAPVPVPVVDLSDRTAAEQREEVLRRWKDEVTRPFDPAARQRLRTTVLHTGPDDHVVLITTDHAAADLVSMAILVQEFAALYAAHRTGRPAELPPLELQYADFAAWQRDFGAERTAAEVAYWRETLDGVSGTLTLPSDRPYPARPTFAGAAHVVDLSAELSERLRRFAELEKASFGVVLLASLSVLLQRYLGRDDLIIGEIVSGRGRAEVERLVGCFVTALPLRMRLAADDTLRDVVEKARRTALTAYDHQDLPIERLVDELNLGREASQTSMTHMWLDVRTPESSLEISGLRISREPIEVTMSAAPLTLDANPNGERVQLQWVYMTDMFDPGTVEVLADQFEAVLRQLVATPDLPAREVTLAVTAPPRPAATQAGPGFVELFRRRVDLAPHAPAVICDGTPTSFAELDLRADRLARRLRAAGVGPETPVGILVGRSVALPTALLGVMKSGGAAVPLDPAYPPERMAFMLADVAAPVLVTTRDLAATLAGSGVDVPDTVVYLDELDELPYAADLAELDPPSPTSAAYVVYTSGSTGRPKGTLVEHRSLVTFARDVVDRLGLGSGDRFLQFASPGFDVLVEELFPTWLAGGAVVIPSQHIISGGVDLADLVERERLTVMELPTAYWHEWTRELDRLGRVLPEHLRLVIIGGERVLPDRLTLWRRLRVPLLHVYGLTETTVSSTFFRLDPADPVHDWPNLPIGTPLPSAELHVLDDALRPVPLGATGELYIGGISVARGYVGRAGLTAHRFVADPVSGRSGGRLYRTGDLVRQRPDGNLEFLARVDTQIKIRGFRVEPSEIEAVLSTHPAVAETVVAMYEPRPGDRRLAAYIVAAPDTRVGHAELRAFLERDLPSYMVPSAFVDLDALPLNANGKVDRDRLPAPDGVRAQPDVQRVAPRTPLEQTIADVVTTVVGLERIGVHENFFEIGGDSILAIQVVARAQEAGLQLSPYDLFAHPTVAALAEVATAGPVLDADQGDVTGPVPVLPGQRPYCVRGLPDVHHRNISVLVELGAAVGDEVAAAAVEHLLRHHDGLRQRFLLAGERTRARIAPRGDATPFHSHDLGSEAEQDRRMAELTAELQADLDPAVGPMLRAALFRLGGRRPDRLILVAHRLVADYASMRVLVEDLRTALTQAAGGREVSLPAKTTSWQSWARRLAAHGNSEAVQGEREYWSASTAEPTGALPRVPADPVADPDDLTVAATDIVRTVLDAELTAAVLAVADGVLRCTPQELVLTALGRALRETTGAPHHVVDVERPGREPLFADVDVSRTVGRFAVTHPLTLTCTPDEALETTLKTVKEALRAVPSGGIGWQLLRRDRDPVPGSPAEILVAHHGTADVATGDGFRVLADADDHDDSPRAGRSHPIELRTSVVTGRLRLECRHAPGRHAADTIEKLVGRVVDGLRALTERTEGAALHTPSDFPLARVDQDQLDSLLSRL